MNLAHRCGQNRYNWGRECRY